MNVNDTASSCMLRKTADPCNPEQHKQGWKIPGKLKMKKKGSKFGLHNVTGCSLKQTNN